MGQRILKNKTKNKEFLFYKREYKLAFSTSFFLVTVWLNENIDN